MTLDELDTLRGKNSPGMLLLGFKPLRWDWQGRHAMGCPEELSRACQCGSPCEAAMHLVCAVWACLAFTAAARSTRPGPAAA